MDVVPRKLALPAVSAALALVVLAPLLGRGFVLSYDMVFAPRQSLVPDAFGLGSSLPRSVPADAVVALTTAVLPGDIVQKLVLALSIFFAAYGAGRLVPTESLGTRIVAATAYAWTAYVAERLFIGHWPLLLTYACLPWIVRWGLALRAGEPKASGRLLLACAPAALTPPGGVIAAVAAIVTAGPRRAWLALGVSAAVNLPWLVATLVHPGGSLSDPAGVAAFSARSESWGPAILSVAGLGGIWNGDVVPGSRSGPLAPVLILVTVGLAIPGFRVLARRWGTAPARSLVLLGVCGILLASLATLPLGEPLLAWATAHVPGAGLLRDAQKWVAWWALPVAMGFALTAEAAARRLRTPQARRAIVIAAAAFPMLVLPDLAWGGWGRLEAVRYPADWQAVHGILAADERPGAVLTLPLSTFRRFAWNDNRTQLDPAPRVLPRTVLIDDTLRVGGEEIAGEDSRLEAVRRATSAGDLTASGIGWVLVEHGTPGIVDARLLAGARPIWSGPWLTLYRTPGEPGAIDVVAGREVAVFAANGLALISIMAALLWCGLPISRLIPGSSTRTVKPAKE
jgi:hypothetical protein